MRPPSAYDGACNALEATYRLARSILASSLGGNFSTMTTAPEVDCSPLQAGWLRCSSHSCSLIFFRIPQILNWASYCAFLHRENMSGLQMTQFWVLILTLRRTCVRFASWSLLLPSLSEGVDSRIFASVLSLPSLRLSTPRRLSHMAG